MRIMETKPFIDWAPAESFKSGTPVRFEHAFHQKHRPEDLFIINEICGSYRPADQSKYKYKIGVTNLRTGELAYVERDRRCAYVPSRVEIGDPKE